MLKGRRFSRGVKFHPVSAALQAAKKVSVLLFGRERRALALRKIQQIQGALAPGLLFVEPQSSFFRSLFSR
jgi:hypothetical protein